MDENFAFLKRVFEQLLLIVRIAAAILFASVVSAFLSRYVLDGDDRATFIFFLLLVLAQMFVYDRYRRWRASKASN